MAKKDSIIIEIPEVQLDLSNESWKEQLKNDFHDIQYSLEKKPDPSSPAYYTWFWFFLKYGKSLCSQEVQDYMRESNNPKFFEFVRDILGLGMSGGGAYTIGYKFYDECLKNRTCINSCGIKIHKMSSTCTSLIDEPLQQIFYGAPGTGKSYKVNEISKEYSTIRTTFHPDSDYSTFVGAYKPTMAQIRKSVVVERQEKEVTPLEGNSEYDSKIKYSFVKQAFLKAYLGAWKKYSESKKNDDGMLEVQPQFLVIEEINRGNCAQIFGDLFQLLDRQEKNGFSCYPIEADSDLQQEIENAFRNEKAYKLGKIDVDDMVDGYTSNYEHEDGTLCTLSEDIQSGRILLLPNNLYIWATMNTSDQSLFPIDSAFKRRWAWEYVRIAEGRDNDTHKPLLYSLSINGTDYDWWSFIQEINKRIGSITSSEDKKLGYFFCGTEDGKISASKFVGKVCFYLWNDIFKDFGFGKKDQSAPFKKVDGKDISFDDFYMEDPSTFRTIVNEPLLEDFVKKLGVETIEQRKIREGQTNQRTQLQAE